MDYLPTLTTLTNYGSAYYHTHHVGNLYCGALAVESGVRCLILVVETVKSCYLLGKEAYEKGKEAYAKDSLHNANGTKVRWWAIYKGTLFDEKGSEIEKIKEWGHVRDAFRNLFFRGFQTIALAYGAFHPIAGVALPILLSGSYFLLGEKSEEVHIYENCPVVGSVGRIVYDITDVLCRWTIPNLALLKIKNLILGKGVGYDSDREREKIMKWVGVIGYAAAAFAAFRYLGISSSFSLEGYKFIPISLHLQIG